LAYTLNRLGTWFGNIALAILVYDRTGSELAVAGLLICAQVLPAFFVPAVIARVEARRSRGGLSALYCIEAVAFALLALVAVHGASLVPILVLVAIDGIAALSANALVRTSAAKTAREAVLADAGEAEPDAEAIAQAVRDEGTANSTMNLGFAVTYAAGPLLAGLIVPAWGVAAALWIDVASFLVCAAMMLDLTPHVRPGLDETVRMRLAAARRHIASMPVLQLLLGVEAVAVVFFTFGGPLQVAYAKTTLGAGAQGYGLLAAVWGLGVTAGSIMFARAENRSLVRLLLLSTLAVGAAYIGFWAAPTLAVATFAGFVGGVGNGIQWASLVGCVQRLTPHELLGQMMGATEIIGSIAPAAGYLLAGLIAMHTSVRTAFLVGGIGACVTLIGFARVPRSRVDDPAPAPAG
jgi:MFS family permease